MLHGKQMLSIEAQKEFNILLEEVRVFWDGADEAFKNDSLDEFVNDLVRNNVNEFPILNGLYDILAGKNNYTKLGLIKKRITEAMLIPREEQITANRDSYVSPPLGRYTNEELSSDGFKLVSLTNTEQTGPHVSGFEAFVLCTDGVKVDTDILNDQTEALENGVPLVQETRGWDENKSQTFAQRKKESAHDYRYFPEPDILPFQFDEEYFTHLRSTLPELPLAKSKRFI